jgi:hypothetical protein
MKTMHVLSILLAMGGPALAQSSVAHSQETSRQGLNGKTMESCKRDLQKFCDAANLKQECLVAHWTKISSDCQDALARPMHPAGNGG